jgi:WD40 repeat protein
MAVVAFCVATVIVAAPPRSSAQGTVAPEPRILGAGTESPARLTRVIAASSDGRLVASGDTYGDGTITVWETANWTARLDLPRQKWPIEALRFSPDSRILYVADEVGRTAVIDLTTGREIRSIRGRRRLFRYFRALSVFSADGALVAIYFRPGRLDIRTLTVEVYSTLTKKRVGRIRVADELDISTMCFTPDATNLLVGAYASEVLAYDVKTGLPKYKLDGIGADSGAIVASVPLNEIAVPGGDSVVRLDATTGARKGVFDYGNYIGKHTRVEGISIDNAGRFLATTHSDNRLRVWNRLSGEPICELEMSPFGGGLQIAFIPGRNLLVSTSETSKLYVFDISPYLPTPAVKP